MHTSGICYRFTDRPYLGRLYAEAGICDGLTPSEVSLAENVRRLAGLPLHHQPGTAWEYGLNTDVLGRLVEVVSGQSLGAFIGRRIFRPLKMNETYLPPARGRDATAWPRLYEPGPDGKIKRAADGPTVKGALDLLGERGLPAAAGLFLRRRGPALDGRRLRPVPPDAAQPRRAGRGPRAPARDGRRDDPRPDRGPAALDSGARVRLRLRLRRERPGRTPTARRTRSAPSVGAGSITPTSGSTRRTR